VKPEEVKRLGRSLLEFLEELEASDNPVCDPENVQAAGYWMAVADARRLAEVEP
jgi:hypothetical protein